MAKPYVIVRTYSAGVFAGTLESRKGQEVVLSKARRIFYWDGAASLSELAMRGTSKPANCKFQVEVDRVELLQAIEILNVTPVAKKNIADGVEVYLEDDLPEAPDELTCRRCGCTESHACDGGCTWVDAGDPAKGFGPLCSRCWTSEREVKPSKKARAAAHKGIVQKHEVASAVPAKRQYPRRFKKQVEKEPAQKGSVKTPQVHRSWKDDDDFLRDAVKDGSMAEEIAVALDRSETAVLQRMSTLGLRSKNRRTMVNSQKDNEYMAKVREEQRTKKPVVSE